MASAPASTPRRSPTGESQGRTDLLDAAQQLMLEEGYASVTARRVAAKAGRGPQLVHYYFSSMDDLFVQMVQRGARLTRQRLASAADDAQPLRALWKISTDPVTAALTTEWMALANHRKAIADEVASAGTEFRLAQHAAFSEALARHGVDGGGLSVGVVLVALEGLARLIAMEQGVGTSTFHDEALQAVEDALLRLEGPPAR